jgi:hypothetical protein
MSIEKKRGAMSRTILHRFRPKNWRKLRDTWVAELGHMADDVERWSAQNDWDTLRETRELEEEEIGTYEVPVVRIQTMQGRLYFEPVSWSVCGAEGRIEITAARSFYQVVLVKNNGKWWFADPDEDFKNLRKSWTRQGFTAIAGYLLKKR